MKVKFKSNAQRRAVFSQMNGQKKAETMQTIKARWEKRNKIKYERGEIPKDKYIEENKRLNDGTYTEFIESQAEFVIKNKVQLNPV